MSKQDKIYLIATLSNTVLLLGCAVFLWMGRDEPTSIASTHTSSHTSANHSLQSGERENNRPRKAPDGLAGLFADIMEPVRKAAQDHQDDPKLYLPSEEELAAAIASERLESPESSVVLEKLKVGYAKFTMPFPSLAAPPPSPPSQPSAQKDPKEVEAWLMPTIQRLIEEAKTQSGETPSESILPTKEEQNAAIQKGSFDSQEFDVVRSKLEQGYQRYQIPFPVPGQPQTAPPEPNSPRNPEEQGVASSQRNTSESVAEQQIINAYFQGQLQRIKLESKKKDEDVSDCFPTSAQIQTAVQSGSISSAESLSVISILETCYQRLDIPFHPPVRQ